MIRHHEQPVPLAVVAGVHDDGQAFAEVRLQAVGQLGAPDTTRERDDRRVRHAFRISRTSPIRSIVSRS